MIPKVEAQEETPPLELEDQTLTETVDGLTFTDGVFYPTYSIQGMTYNSETQSYQMPPMSSNSEGGGGGGGGGTDPATLFTAFNEAGSKASYFQQLSDVDKAGLFSYSPAQGGPTTEDKNLMVDSFVYDPALLSTYAGADDPYIAKRAELQGFLDALTDDAKFVEALNLRDQVMGKVYPGAPDYYGSFGWGGLEKLDLSGRNLSGLNVSGKDIRGANLSESTGIASTLHLASNLFSVNLSNSDLTGFQTSGKNLNQIDLSGSTITSQQLQDASLIRAIKLRNTNLTGFSFLTANGNAREISGVDFTGSTGLTVQQFLPAANASGFFGGVNLTGTGITRDALASAMADAGYTNTWQLDGGNNIYDTAP